MRISDWSSDVCSSDLASRATLQAVVPALQTVIAGLSSRQSMPEPDSRPLRRGSVPRQNGPSGQARGRQLERSEEHTSELQSLMRSSYAVFCLKNKITRPRTIFIKPLQHVHHRSSTYFESLTKYAEYTYHRPHIIH